MNKSISLSLVVLLLCIGFAFYIGTWFGGKDTVPSEYKHKYDSLTSLVVTQQNIMIHNQLLKDSLRNAQASLKFREESIAKEYAIKKKGLIAERKELVDKWKRDSTDVIAKEMTKRFKQAHPAPLFDTAVGPDVTIGKNVSIHYLERDEEAKDLQFEVTSLKTQLEISQTRVNNYMEQLHKSTEDVIAQAKIIEAKDQQLALDKTNATDVAKQNKKALNRQKVQKWVATAFGAAMTYLAIAAASH